MTFTLIEQMAVFIPINYILFHSGKYGASIVNSPGIIQLSSTLSSVNTYTVMRKEEAADFYEGTNTLVLYNFIFVYIYHIASNYGLGVYFFPAIFNQATKQDRCFLSEETRAVYNL